MCVTHGVQAKFKPLHLTACCFHHLLTSYICYIILLFSSCNLASFKSFTWKLCFVFVCFSVIDRWWCEGQSVVGVGPHLHSVWKETDEEVGEPAPHRPAVSPGPLIKTDCQCWTALIQLLCLFLSYSWFIYLFLVKFRLEMWVMAMCFYYFSSCLSANEISF